MTQVLARQSKNVIKMGNLVVIWGVFVCMSIIMVLYFVLVVGFCGEALIAAAMDQRWDLAVQPALEEWTSSCCVSSFMCVFVCVCVCAHAHARAKTYVRYLVLKLNYWKAISVSQVLCNHRHRVLDSLMVDNIFPMGIVFPAVWDAVICCCLWVSNHCLELLEVTRWLTPTTTACNN